MADIRLIFFRVFGKADAQLHCQWIRWLNTERAWNNWYWSFGNGRTVTNIFWKGFPWPWDKDIIPRRKTSMACIYVVLFETQRTLISSKLNKSPKFILWQQLLTCKDVDISVEMQPRKTFAVFRSLTNNLNHFFWQTYLLKSKLVSVYSILR